ncbi:MAG: hypothetical protein BGO30_11500 [Bacteroidetes bacterium 41-46]|nr:MAG: hypothetical protein BGO30_11500 [Bacteroidetes bacterium 41-46]
MSTSANYMSALLLALATMPGVMFAKFYLNDISFKKRWLGIYQLICLAMIVLLVEYLSIILTDLYLISTTIDKNAEFIFNPFFIWLMTIAFISLEILLENKINMESEEEIPRFIEFTSERKKISLEIDTITFIESCDDEVWVRTSSEISYRTKMNISNWELTLDSRFIRIHRSYLVNRSHITKITPTKIWVGNKSLEVSRKYGDKVA